MRPRLDEYEDDEAWADAPPSHVGSVYPLGSMPRRKVKKPEFPIGFALPQTPKPEAPKRRRKAKRKGR